MNMELMAETIKRPLAEKKRVDRSIASVCARMPTRNMKLIKQTIDGLRFERERVERDIAGVYAQNAWPHRGP